MDYINNFISQVSNQVVSTKTNGSTLQDLSKNTLLELTDSLNSLFQNHQVNQNLQLPKLVVVGTQSSGKSSVLNSIIGDEIIPTGSTMTTKTPLEIRMKKIEEESQGYLEIGQENSQGWHLKDSLKFSSPLTKSQSRQIKQAIEQETFELVGNEKKISKTPIVMKIFSSKVPNLSLTDLPGLILISSENSSLKEEIEEMVSSYLKEPETMVLTVMASRRDLETDLGLDFVKRQDDQKKTIGVLTKPDLMNSQEEHVTEYLTGKVSKELQLSEGYFLVNNKTENETDYFKNHSIYSKLLDKTGTHNLTSRLSSLLLDSISQKLPHVVKEVYQIEKEVLLELEQLGNKPPESRESKLSALNLYISDFSKEYSQSLEQRGAILGAGMKLKKIFVDFRQEVDKIKIFNSLENYPNSYFQEMISNLEGNHMSFDVPHIEVLETSLTDSQKRPLTYLQKPIRNLVNAVFNQLKETTWQLLGLPRFDRYPQLKKHIAELVINSYLAPLREKAYQEIIKFLEIEESYIWTDNQEFKREFEKLKSRNLIENNFQELRKLLDSYLGTVKETLENLAPKTVMYLIIQESQKNLYQLLYQEIVDKEKIDLIKEEPETESRRNYLNGLKRNISELKSKVSC